MRIRKRSRLAANLAALAAAALIDGCDVFGPAARLRVVLPALPQHWQLTFPDLGVMIEYPGETGAIEKMNAAGWPSAVEVVCLKEGNGPVLAWPLIPRDDDRVLRPAGGLYPLSLEAAEASEGAGERAEVLRLSWEDGPLAVIMSSLLECGREPDLVNAERLRGELRGVPDPWTWDLAHIAERLAIGDFTFYDLDRLPSSDARVAPGEGEWFLETPFAEPFAALDGETVTLSGLSHGMHNLFAVDGRRLGVWLDGKGVVTIPWSGAAYPRFQSMPASADRSPVK